MRHILYSFRRCPYAMRARMSLIISGAVYEHREIILRNKPASMLTASPKGTVPVLILSDGTVIDESRDVIDWALGRSDPKGWLGADISQMSALMDQNDGEFKHHLDRYKYASRYSGDAKRGDVDLSHRVQAETFIQALEDRLAQNAYLMGDTPRLADYAIFPFIRQFANTDIEWWNGAPYAKTRAWLSAHLESDLFKTCMTKHKLWEDAA